MAFLSLRAYAKHRKCALSAVQRAIESGRLTASVAYDGRGHPKITDAVAADAEWKATTHADRVPLAVQARLAAAAPIPPPPPLANTPPHADAGGGRGRGDDGDLNMFEARARLDVAKAAIAELDLAERRRELMPAKDLEQQLVTLFAECKTKLLGVPSRARQQDPALTRPQIDLFESLIVEALEGLAAESDGARPT